jgi:hypothetical protein
MRFGAHLGTHTIDSYRRVKYVTENVKRKVAILILLRFRQLVYNELGIKIYKASLDNRKGLTN